MSFAPMSVSFSHGDGSIIGSFYEKSCGNFFEYASNPAADSWVDANEYPHRVFVKENPVNDSGWRYARVLKTVAYVVVDEDDYGRPVVEKWKLKGGRIYPRPEW